VEEYVLIQAAEGRQSEVVAFLRALPGVDEVRPIDYGRFDIVARIRSTTHTTAQHVISDKLAFHEGVERIEEIGDADECAGILRALDIHPTGGPE
jgi:hypothetical protein